ncbi:hypothetical protein [Streptomyces sp. NPDC048606]|uniref:hypothetical protein n=1 Tax=Streptomyces sp. NPDC048606 TaxID=3154726 RepID=UPI003445A092
MGSPIEIFRLFAYRPCGHELLVRVTRPGAPNWNQVALDAADRIADEATDRLRLGWEQGHLRAECPHPHTSALMGESQDFPVGEELHGPGGRRLEVWTARTNHGAPWVVLGTAPSEAEFRQEVSEDSEFTSTRVVGPVELHQVYFLAEEEDPSDAQP